MGLERVHRFTTAYSASTYQLVLSAKRESDGKWMQVVYATFYVDSYSSYRFYIGNVAEKPDTSISDSHARQC